MALVYLGIGTNLGNKEQNLNNAVACLQQRAGTIVLLSTFYASEPWGFQSENQFLNAALLLETELAPFHLLDVIKDIESQMGRELKTSAEYTDRPIDIDILLYNDLVMDTPTLKIPHPLITERDFVLRPLIELNPELLHPVTGCKLSQYLLR